MGLHRCMMQPSMGMQRSAFVNLPVHFQRHLHNLFLERTNSRLFVSTLLERCSVSSFNNIYLILHAKGFQINCSVELEIHLVITNNNKHGITSMLFCMLGGTSTTRDDEQLLSKLGGIRSVVISGITDLR